MKKIAVILCAVFLFSMCSVASFASENENKNSFDLFCYNVSGLPDVGFITGSDDNIMYNQIDIGRFFNENSYDIIVTQEDFMYNENLTDNMPDYIYKTLHKGSVPYGDGTSVYTKSFKLYNETHTPWNTLYGLADNGADEFSEKGILYVCVEIADGVYLDLYNIHADAFGDSGSVAARRDNFRQLADMINSRSVDRPVIIAGDFNQCMFPHAEDGIYDVFVQELGMKDSWVEVCNGGDYEDVSSFTEKYGNSWSDKFGVWDSIERFFYKDGGGVALTCESFEYIDVVNRKGVSCSDHKACYSEFSFEVTDPSLISNEGLEVVSKNMIEEYFRRIVVFFEKLILGIQNLDTILSYLGI